MIRPSPIREANDNHFHRRQLRIRRLLMRRFEKIPEWAEERLEKASRDELENSADRVVDAETLEQVFAAS